MTDILVPASLLQNDVFILFFIIALGKLLEQVRIKQFSLGIASIFIIAAVFGYYGFTLNGDFQSFALALFIYCVGLEAGPQFAALFSQSGLRWLPVPFLYTAALMAVTLATAFFSGDRFPAGTFVGLYTGAYISTPAMASVLAHSADAAIGAAFGLIYPLSFVGTIYLVPLLPHIFRHPVDRLVAEYKQKAIDPANARVVAFFRVSNPNIIGKGFDALSRFGLNEVVFSRYIEQGKSRLADPAVTLREGGFVAAVGRRADLESLALLIGPAEEPQLDSSDPLATRRILVSRRNVAGKTLRSLDVDHACAVRITRIVRGSVELPPEPDRQIVLGDRVVAVGTVENLDRLTRLLGDDVEEMFKTQFAPISIGITLGILIGTLPIPGLGYRLGLTGGVLITALYLGHRVKFLGVLWQMPHQANAFLRQFSLYVFYVAAGTSVGKELFHLFADPGSALLITECFVLAFLPLILTYAIATLVLRKHPLETVGLLAGTLNNTSIVAYAGDKMKSDIANAPFSFAYPLGLLLALMSAEAMLPLLKLIMP
ncbi:MAG TPA: TrkA C-terminal domain-containing protein [bacterium]|nr:TrkA C-terminal domain-containing protein [bacterium]